MSQALNLAQSRKSGRHSLITGPARPGCDQQQRARSQKIRPIPAQPGARPRGIRGPPLKWWPSTPVCLARCYFTWKIMYSCVAFFRYFTWKFKMFKWHIGYNTWKFVVAYWLFHVIHHHRPPPSSSSVIFRWSATPLPQLGRVSALRSFGVLFYLFIPSLSQNYQISHGITCWGSACILGLAMPPIPREWSSSAPQFLGFSWIYAYIL